MEKEKVSRQCYGWQLVCIGLFPPFPLDELETEGAFNISFLRKYWGAKTKDIKNLSMGPSYFNHQSKVLHEWIVAIGNSM